MTNSSISQLPLRRCSGIQTALTVIRSLCGARCT
jgi:hypothetical protein